MVSERLQRRIDALLEDADAAMARLDWATVAERARAVLAADPENEDGLAYLAMAERGLATGESQQESRPKGEGESPKAKAESGGRVAAGMPSDQEPSTPLARRAGEGQGVPAGRDSYAAGRYAVRGFLGRGGSKLVYLAHDTRLDRDVALAVVEGLDGDSLERVRREAQAVARLGDHPNIVSVFDTGDEGDALYTVYQYMAGGSLAERIAAAPDHRLPLKDAVRYASQVCAALSFAHAKGVIHRDLKPQNVFLDDDGTAKLGDFGLAAALDRSRLTQHGTFLGTAVYMPPEQAMGQPPDPRSDLYALGCVLYEMLTGRPPFVGDDTVAIVTQHLNTPPIAPAWHRPDVPPGLEALVLSLLEKDPAKRPQSAADVQASLAAVALTPGPSPGFAGEGSGRSTQSSVLSPQSSDPIYRQTFVGREAELRQLQSAFDGALSGNGALVMVVGEPGIGKTSVCEQLATYAAMRGGRTLRGHCYEEGSLSLPYLPFVEALRTYVLDRDPDALRSELGSNAPYVARIVSELRDKLDVEPPGAGDPDDDRWRLLQGVTTFLRNAANVQPLVIVLEDLHWADKGTLDVLTHIARSLEGARLCIVGTYRDVEVDRLHPLSGALAELRRITNFSRVTLRGLGADDVQKMLGNIAGREVPWALAEQVHRQTEGNPLFVQEVLRYLVEEGFLQRDSHGALQRPSSDISLAMQIPEGLRDVIGKRLSRLSPETNKVLAVAAVIGRDFRLDVLQDVANVTEEELYAALEEASGKGVLEERRQQGSLGYRFAHAFLRQTLYEEIFTPRRIRTHQQVARAMETRYASRVAEHAAELAEHFAQSTDPDDLAKAVQYGELAAQRAMSVYAHSEAVRLLDAALQAQEVLDPDNRLKRCDLLLALGTALLPAGEPLRANDPVAEEAFALAVAMGDAERACGACRTGIAGLYQYGGPPIAGTPAYRQWAERLQARAPIGSVHQVYAGTARVRLMIADQEWAATWPVLESTLALARTLDDNEALFTAAGLMISPPHTVATLDAARTLALEFTGRPHHGVSIPTLTFMLSGLSTTFLQWGDWPRAQAAATEQQQLADRTLHPAAILSALFWQSRSALLDGRIAEAVDTQDSRQAMAKILGSEAYGALTSRFFVRPKLYLGLADEAVADIDRDERGEVFNQFPRDLCLVHAGRLDEARAGIERFLELGPGRVTLVWQAYALEAAILTGHASAVATLRGTLLPLADVATCRDALISGGRLLGMAAMFLNEPDEARDLFNRALKACAPIGFRPEIALTRLHLARLLFDHYPAERDEALDHLAFAIAEFQHMKMAPSLEEAMRLRLHVSGADTSDPSSSIVAVSRLAQAEQPDLSRVAAPDGSITLMFTDIEGSTALNERLGDERWVEVLRHHNAVVERQVKAHGGTVVKNRGDGYMAVFPSPEAGVRCAVAIQAALTPGPSPDFAGEGSAVAGPLGPRTSDLAPSIRVRVGLHTGNPVREGKDFFGTDVNLAARVADRALGGQVLVSSRLYNMLGAERAGRFGEPVEVELKGLAGRHRVYAVR
jgi:serine/threonine protein kinase/class 3 adenylate cyclase